MKVINLSYLEGGEYPIENYMEGYSEETMYGEKLHIRRYYFDSTKNDIFINRIFLEIAKKDFKWQK